MMAKLTSLKHALHFEGWEQVTQILCSAMGVTLLVLLVSDYTLALCTEQIM